MFTWLFWLMLATASLDWLGSWRGWRTVRWVTKPGTLVLMIAWFTQIGGWRGPLIWFGLGLLFSLVGDVLLHLPERFFLPGVGAFLLAHVFYIVGFSVQLFSPLKLGWEAMLPLVLVGAVYFLLGQRLRAGLKAHGQSALTIPVTIYATLLSLMLLMALFTPLRPDWSIQAAVVVSMGAGLFFLSDSILAFGRFVKPIRYFDVLVMVTYHLGQILITAGALQQYVR